MQIMWRFYSEERPYGSKRADAAPVSALEKKGWGSFTRLEAIGGNGMASFTCDEEAFLEKGQGSRQTNRR